MGFKKALLLLYVSAHLYLLIYSLPCEISSSWISFFFLQVVLKETTRPDSFLPAVSLLLALCFMPAFILFVLLPIH